MEKKSRTRSHKTFAPRVTQSEVGPSRALGTGFSAACGMIEVAPGVEVYFEERAGEGTPLFFVYGLGCAISHWKYQMRHFAQHGRRIVWMDFRGHGHSTPLDLRSPLGLKTLSDDIAAVCALRGIQRAVVLGQSMGGTVALTLAAAYRELVAGLVLLATPSGPPSKGLPFGPFGRKIWHGAIRLNVLRPELVRLAHHGMKQFPGPMRELIRLTGFNPFLARTDDITEYIDELLATDPNTFLKLASDLESFRLENFSPPIACPALVIAGALDQVVPMKQHRWLARRLPGSELEMVPHGSHCPHFDDPSLVNRRIAKFLGERGF